MSSQQFGAHFKSERLFFTLNMIGNNSAGQNALTGNTSRRQSNVPRGADSESVSSLHGSLKRVAEYSPKSGRKQLSRTPLYLSRNSRTTLEQTELLHTNDIFRPDDDPINQYQLQLDKNTYAIFRPRRILYTNYENRSFLSTIDLNYNKACQLRECKSLDLIPSNQLRHRVDPKRLPIAKISDQNTCSLDAGVSMICRDPMPKPFDLDNLHGDIDFGSNHIIPDSYTTQIDNKSKNSYKTPNNCNGPLTEDAHCPLLYRQNSLSNPQDENVVQQKRWRSLETVQHSRSDSETSAPKRTMNRGSIRSWLVNLFQGNGFNDASLRKTGAQNRVKGFSGFSELPPAPENESIV